MPIVPALVIFDLCLWGMALAAYFVARRAAWRSLAAELRIFLLLAALGCCASLLLGRVVYQNNFASLRFLAHTLFCLLAPVLFWRSMVLGFAGRRGLGAAGALLALGGEAVYIYARQVEPYWLDVTRYTYTTPRLPAGTRPIKVVVLADLQTDRIGAYEEMVFARMDAERADLILLPGDYLQFRPGQDEAWRNRTRAALQGLFNGLRHRPRYGIWGVDGDTDSVRTSLQGTRVQPVSGRLVTLPGEPPLQLWGLRRAQSRMPHIALRGRNRQAIHDFPGLTIVLGHAPDYAIPDLEVVERDGPEACRLPALCIAGHTHGGQVSIPFIGPPITLSNLPRRYITGLHRFGEMGLLVSRGVGHEQGYAPRLRFNCRPELAVVELRSAAER